MGRKEESDMKSISKMIKAVLMIVLFVIFALIPQAAAQETCVSPPSGMVSWWSGDGNANDIVGSNDGTLFNGVTFASGKVGQAFSLDGVDDFVSVPNATSLQLQDFTIDAWIKLTGSVTGWPKSLAAFGQYGYAFAIDGGTYTGGALRSLVLSKTGASQINGPVVPGDGAWHHVAVSKAGSSVTFYIDGVGSATSYSVFFTFNGAAGGDFAIGTNPIYASQGNPPSIYAFPGLVDELEVFNRALSTAEIAAIYNAGSAGKCKVTTVDIVDIDIKPGSDPNSINPRSKGVIPVAILTTETFDATTVDPLSVAFGPNAAMETHGQGHIEDADGDGDLDLVLHFRTQDIGIQCGDTTASLTGETLSGQTINGSDSINTVGCK